MTSFVLDKRELLEAGAHFGHPTRRWNPKMRPFIFQKRNGIYIVDLDQTLAMFQTAYEFVRDTVAQGGEILFVATKRQAQDIIREEAQRCGAFYVNRRWVGGLLTNWDTIRKRIERLKELETLVQDENYLQSLSKKEAKSLIKEYENLLRLYEGVKEMRQLPGVLYIVDILREMNAVREARRIGIPIVAILDTNCDPDLVDYGFPGNDDAVRSIRVFTKKIADAVLEGRRMREAYAVAEEEMTPADDSEETMQTQELEELEELEDA